jgi:hypothetical protein
MRTAAKAMPLPPIPFIVISKGKREEPQLVIDQANGRSRPR